MLRAPRGGRPDLWRLELPSVLGAAFGPAETEVDSPDIEYQTEDEEGSDDDEDQSLYHEGSSVHPPAGVKTSCDGVIEVMDLTAAEDLLESAAPDSDYAATEIDPVEPAYDVTADGDVRPSNNDRRADGPHITLEVPYSMPPEQLVEQWNIPADHVWVLERPAIVDEVPPEHPLELFAYRALRRGSMNLELMQDMLQAIIQCLPQLVKARKRKRTDFSITKEGQSFSLTWGSYVIGGCGGIARNTHNYSWLSRLLVALIRGQRKEHIFSSVSLRLNTYMTPHLDKHNHPALPSLLVACGRWQGGGLWVSERALPQQSSGDMMGRVYNVDNPSVLFRSHVLHSTMAWRGQRFVMVAYANNGIKTLREEDKEILTNLGFDSRY